MQSSYLLINDLRVHYLHWNLGLGGQPAVLLHGLASNARIWELVAPYLQEHGMQVLAPDGRGHGLTDKPEGDYGFETFQHDLAGFINALELERPLLVGHSWGASVALDYAARVPVGPRAPAGIVLVDGGMIQLDQEPGATWESIRQRLTPPRLAGMPLETFLERLRESSPLWQQDDHHEQDDWLPIILANFEVHADETITPRLSFDHHMQIVRAMWEFKTYERFQRLRCPALLVPARSSEPLSEREAAFIASKERGAAYVLEHNEKVTMKWMDDSIHDIPLQRPAELGRAIYAFAEAL